jgi:hypothetical protein
MLTKLTTPDLLIKAKVESWRSCIIDCIIVVYCSVSKEEK